MQLVRFTSIKMLSKSLNFDDNLPKYELFGPSIQGYAGEGMKIQKANLMKIM